MFDLYSIPVYYISFKKEKDLEKNLTERGFNKIIHFKAINGRKFNPDFLIKKNLITIRSYQDLLLGRHQHSGMSSLGVIGCTMSHNEIWKLCVEYDLPYVAIAEADLYLNEITPHIEEKIKEILKEPNSVFMSEKINKQGIVTFFQRTHFYIISNSACKELINNVFPIDVQTDYYIAHMDTIKKINLDGFIIGTQKKHDSLIQDFCIKCKLPTSVFPYLIIFILFILLVCSTLYLWYSRNKFRNQLLSRKLIKT
jgi:GR25 family glycosyltransferase involved in LPS biosynthesis